MKSSARLAFAAVASLFLCATLPATTKPIAAPVRHAARDRQLEQLCRALKDKKPAAAYARLSAFALRKSSGLSGVRASLALGYFDYTKGNYVQAQKWLSLAQSDPLLRDYSLYWDAETNLALNRNADALAQLQQIRKDYPNSVITDQALQSLGTAALALNQPAAILEALDGYSYTTETPGLLFMRGEAHEQANQPVQAAADYQSVYLRFPTIEEAREAGEKLNFLRGTPAGSQIPQIPLDQLVTHAATLFAAKQWGDARNEYSSLMPQLSGAPRELAQLRELECGVALGETVSELETLKVADPDVDAERFYSIAQWYRNQQQETPMAAAVEAAATRAPSSRWAEASLFLAGNYYWVQLDRDRAAGYYKRLADNFPRIADATPSQWRVAWTAVLERKPAASELLAQHLWRYPGSPFTPDAVYWLGRLAEEAGKPALARAYYAKIEDRFPENYFETLAATRLRALGPGAKENPDVLSAITPRQPAQPLGSAIPLAATARQQRADALRSIAFDASAELELRAGYDATHEPRLLLEAAQTAAVAEHYSSAIVMARLLYPQIETRPIPDVPREIWQVAYPLPFAASIRRWSAHAGVDAMLTAGLIRQESAFDPDARSGANAFGLMQLLPKTARLLARKERIHYSQARLVDPDFNIRLGTVYIAGLKKNFGSVESALAAYNAGEDRVAFWTAGQTYREPAEFVDSIPFTETREYVEIVTRNASIYRELYGAKNESRKIAKKRHR